MTIQNQTYPSTGPCWMINRWASSLEILWWNHGWDRWITEETEGGNTKLCMKGPQLNDINSPPWALRDYAWVPSRAVPVQMQTYPCLWRSSGKRPWGCHGCPGVSTLFSAQRRKKHISPFWVKQTEIVNDFKEHEPMCTLHASPSSTATERASVGLSITLLFWPEKSIATREFSDILLWKRKGNSFFLPGKYIWSYLTVFCWQ